MITTRCYIGLGSNLAGNLASPFAQLQQAVLALQAAPEVDLERLSSCYRSAAVGPGQQPDYCNAVAAVKTTLAPRALLESLQAIEMAQGRARDNMERWGPRTLDLDILLYGDAVIDDSRLKVPHPEMHRRNFVMAPLAEIAPAAEIPGIGIVGEIAAGLDSQGLSIWRDAER